MNKRLLAMQKKKQTPTEDSDNSGPRYPKMPVGHVSEAEDATMDAQVKLSQLQRDLSKAGIDLATFLSDNAGLHIEKPARVLRCPNGEEHTFVSSYLTAEQLRDCVIDDDNIRDPSERTEEALSDIIDEIGEGFQIQAVVAYVNKDGKVCIVEGSRRTAAAIIRDIGLDFDIFKDKPSETVIRWYVEASDKKKKFSDHDLGRMYYQLMERNQLKAKDVAQMKGVDPAIVSVRVNMYCTPNEIKDLLATKATPLAETRRFVKAVNLICAKNREKEAVEAVERELADIEFDSAKDKNKAVIDILTAVATQKSTTKKMSATPERLYQSGRITIDYQRGDRNSTLKFTRLPKDLEAEIVELVKERLAALDS